MDKIFIETLCSSCGFCMPVVAKRSGVLESACKPYKIATLCKLVHACPLNKQLPEAL